MQPYDYIEIKIPAKAQYVGVARLMISGIASRLGFTYDDIEDLKIASSEAITNAVQHAYQDEEGEVVVGCALFEDRLEIMIADHGGSFDFEETKKHIGPYDESAEVEFLREGGLGLYLMETLMDEVKLHHEEGVTVFMTKYLGGERGEEDVKRTASS
ncbi:serine-protein kinase RsbW [Sporosarcina sp. NCCP-2222]|uniref:anti-sigma B factor RsbW n=1 Tax=Sporosarcina TaxID=1569 RepID=UPI001EE0C76B|nr:MULTISPECIES: anti-sigma B factor RsbW [Sporosarcina]MCG3086717.1 anti-sigma B factor RsbW [Sporosarcina cyprini]GKV54811.1 serine-protein kinase RsbW [Sporosarcina sp. NCCP-2222]